MILIPCTNLAELVKAEAHLINRHLDRHAWFNQIPTQQEAAVDFINKYGFVMREMYCGQVCSHRYACDIAKPYIPPSRGIFG